MKTGIITIYDNTNIGNRLQNYALQQMLLQFCDSVITIKNKPAPTSFFDHIKMQLNLGDSIFLNMITGHKRKAMFLKFNRRYIRISKKCYYYNTDIKGNIEHCDCYCSGSDQVWNPVLKITGPMHFLSFSEKERNFSYAASFGISQIPIFYQDVVGEGLKNFQYISVREDSGKQIVKKLIGKDDTKVLIDPTLYFDSSEWRKISRKPIYFKKRKYILVYFLGDMPEIRKKTIKDIADNRKYEVIDILDVHSNFYAIGPSEFVYLVQHAELICTDSFHASVFSFIFEKPLAIFPRKGTGGNMGNRLESFANKFDLTNTLIKDEIICEKIFDTNYSKGFETLKDERNKTRNYLNEIYSKLYKD